MACAKVFTSRNSYAVRIPKKFHIDFSELFIKKIASSIILTPKESNRENLERSLSEFSSDFMSVRKKSTCNARKVENRTKSTYPDAERTLRSNRLLNPPHE